MRESQKCKKYIKSMITKGKWRYNEKIPTLKQISQSINVSTSTIRKSIISLEKQGILDNCGLSGWYVIKPITSTKRSIKNNILLLRNNINAYTMLANKGKRIKNWIVTIENEKNIRCLNIISGEEIITNFNEIEETIKYPIELKKLLNLNGEKFNHIKNKYDKQQKILPFAKTIYRSKEKLDI